MLKAVLIIAVGATAACAVGTFEFHSGGAHHPAGYGAWLVTATTAGLFAVQHDVRGTVYDCGSFTLAGPENENLWRLIKRADVAGRRPDDRPGLPDEPRYVFVVSDGASSCRLEIWRDEAVKDKNVVALLDYLAELIKKYAGARPVLR